MKYDIKLSKQAQDDFNSYINYIMREYHAPITALKHYEELSATINSLRTVAAIYAIQDHPALLRFGHNVRRVNYKKMAIIYTIHENIVYIHRIVTGSVISGL